MAWMFFNTAVCTDHAARRALALCAILFFSPTLFLSNSLSHRPLTPHLSLSPPPSLLQPRGWFHTLEIVHFSSGHGALAFIFQPVADVHLCGCVRWNVVWKCRFRFFHSPSRVALLPCSVPERVANRRQRASLRETGFRNKSKGTSAIQFCCGTTCATRPLGNVSPRRRFGHVTFVSWRGKLRLPRTGLAIKKPTCDWLGLWRPWSQGVWLWFCHWRRWGVFQHFYLSSLFLRAEGCTKTRVRWEMEDRSAYLRVRESRRKEARERKYVFVCQWKRAFLYDSRRVYETLPQPLCFVSCPRASLQFLMDSLRGPVWF